MGGRTSWLAIIVNFLFSEDELLWEGEPPGEP
jgi:hypothetical protein